MSEAGDHAAPLGTPSGLDLSEHIRKAGDAAAALEPGRGHLDLFGMASLERAGLGLKYEHRLHQNVSAFADGWLTKDRQDGGWRTNAGVLGGLRVSW